MERGANLVAAVVLADGSMIVAGLLFGLFRRRVPKLPVKIYLLFLIPIAVDGLTQLFGLRTSSWWLRTLTGALFGMATVWLAYPYVQESMDQTRRDTERKLNLETVLPHAKILP